MRKPTILAAVPAVLAVLCLGFATAAADEPGARPLKVGYIDLTRVLKEYPKREKLENELRTLQDEVRRDGETRVAEVNRLRQEIEQLAKGTPERIDLERKAQNALVELQKFNQESQKLVEARMAEMLRALYKDVTVEVTRIGQEGGYDFILKDQAIERAALNRRQLVFDISQRLVLYAQPQYDISDAVIKRLREKYAVKTGPAGEPGTAPAK